MVGMRSWTPVALPGGYGAEEDGWFDCQGASAWINPNCYFTQEKEASAAEKEPVEKEETPPNPGYDPYKKESTGRQGGRPVPWGTILPVGLGVLALTGALVFATRKKGR